MSSLRSVKSLPEFKDSAEDTWSQFSEWVCCMAVVTFDLEIGQAMEFSYPNHIKLSDVEKANISYLAFPDSNSGCMGDTQYCFRIRRTSLSKQRISYTDQSYAKDCPVTLLKDDSHFYGYVYFRQVRDKTLKRGYFQKSVVLLSSLPYYNFFKDLVEIIAPEYFDHGEVCLEAACADIDKWPHPIPGKTLNLPLMGMVLHIRIPTNQDKPGTTVLNGDAKTLSLSPCTLSSINEVNLYESLREVLPHMHLLWELVLLGEPMVVMAPTPTVCASTVLALVSSISPLRYHCDFRPYFTIHDSEFKEYTSKSKDPPHVILGVTNPFFTKTFQHWPNIVRVGEMVRGNFGSNPSLLSSDAKVKKTSKLKTFEQKSGVFSKHKPFLKKDNRFLKAFTKGLVGKGSGKEESALIRRHLLELTQSFIIPLERYVASLMPLQKSISPLKAPPTLKPFSPREFLEAVENNGPQLTSVTKGNWVGLYERFLYTLNFEHWLRSRRREMKGKVLSLHLLSLSQTDVESWSEGKSEVEMVDMVLLLRKKMRMVKDRKLDVPPRTMERLEEQLHTIIASLPSDLQGILLKGNPNNEVT